MLDAHMDTPAASAVRRAVRAYRIREGLTQAQFAARLRPLLGTWATQANVSRLETGLLGVDVDVAVALCRALGIAIAPLLTGGDATPTGTATPTLDARVAALPRDLQDAVRTTVEAYERLLAARQPVAATPPSRRQAASPPTTRVRQRTGR